MRAPGRSPWAIADLTPGADRAAQLAAVADPDRTGQCPVRISGDLPQPAAQALITRHAHAHRIRAADQPGRTRSMTTIQQPHSGKPGEHQSLRKLRGGSIADSARVT